jgi:hypothetical protein
MEMTSKTTQSGKLFFQKEQSWLDAIVGEKKE